ncbi:MAG: dipeptidase [Desulfobacterales bacterium]|nr:MAG: dipeptidase [Desulfobacterales bacterium]
MDKAHQLHKESIVIDATCPLASFRDYWQNYIQGGATAIAPTVNRPPELLRDSMRRVGIWLEALRKNEDRMIQVTSVEDIYRAKKENKLGIIFHFQGTTPFETDLNNIEIYYRLGVRMVQLTYNVKDFVGDGCAERTNCGLSEFGLRVIAELDRLGIVIDCSHTGYQTTLEAIEASRNPVIISHGNARAVCDNKRNLPDDVIKAVAKNGGVMGLNGYPDFVSEEKPRTLDKLIDHAEYYAKLVGIEHISVGIDYYEGQAGVASDEEAMALYNKFVEAGIWNPREYSPPPFLYPEGIEMPEKLGNLTAGLLRRGFGEEDVKKIMGLNLIRVFKEVWK